MNTKKAIRIAIIVILALVMIAIPLTSPIHAVGEDFTKSPPRSLEEENTGLLPEPEEPEILEKKPSVSTNDLFREEDNTVSEDTLISVDENIVAEENPTPDALDSISANASGNEQQHGDEAEEIIQEYRNTIAEGKLSHSQPTADWYKNWYYVLETEHSYIILVRYGYDKDGNKIMDAPADVVIPEKAEIDGITYRSTLLNTASMSWYDDEERISNQYSPFHQNTDITSVTIRERVRSGSNLKLSRLFYGCENLVSADISGLYCDFADEDKNRSVNNAYQTFYGCRSLADIDLGEMKFDGCHTTKEMFCGCESLKSLDLGNWDTEITSDMTGMFKDCKGLKTLDISGFAIGARTKVSDMFAGDDALIRIKTPKTFLSQGSAAFPHEMKREEDTQIPPEELFTKLDSETPAKTWLVSYDPDVELEPVAFSVSVPALITLDQDSDGYLTGAAEITVTGDLKNNDFIEATLSDFDMNGRSGTVEAGVIQTKTRWTGADISEKSSNVTIRSKERVNGVGSYVGHTTLTIRSGSTD